MVPRPTQRCILFLEFGERLYRFQFTPPAFRLSGRGVF